LNPDVLFDAVKVLRDVIRIDAEMLPAFTGAWLFGSEFNRDWIPAPANVIERNIQGGH
jgi:hypothetical protein